MASKLHGRRIAILATDGVEQSELVEPRRALEEAGAEVHLVSIKPGRIQAFKHLDKGDTVRVDRTLGEVHASDYEALVLPGGVANPDMLRMHPEAIQFARDFFAAGKPVGAICHGPWLLVEADLVRHRTLTSWPSLRTDITNAGGRWVDEMVHVDNRLVTSRKPDDLPAFSSRLIAEIAEGTHETARISNGEGDVHEIEPRDEDAVVDVSVADSFPASDAPSSLKVT